mgnify:CR=1 FL=1
MRNGPVLFVFGLLAMVISWGCIVMGSVKQIGTLASHADLMTGALYPVNRPGTAHQGAEVYRELGCNQCHTRFAVQDELSFGAELTKLGDATNSVELAVAALLKVNPEWNEAKAKDKLNDLPLIMVERTIPYFADRAVKLLEAADAKAQMTVYNLGADIERGWGARQTVARDMIYDSTVLAGTQRIGPDLANIGTRAPADHVGAWEFTPTVTNIVGTTTNLTNLPEDQRLNWHLVHLYDPKAHVSNSIMPSYRFLFRAISREQAGTVSGALKFPSGKGPKTEIIVPTRKALALAAWLMDQRADTSLPEGPIPLLAPAPEKTAEQKAAKDEDKAEGKS